MLSQALTLSSRNKTRSNYGLTPDPTQLKQQFRALKQEKPS